MHGSSARLLRSRLITVAFIAALSGLGDCDCAPDDCMVDPTLCGIGSGGGDDSGGDEPGGDEPGGDPATFAPQPTLLEARDPATRISEAPSGGCQVPSPSEVAGGWSLETLVGGRYCVYRWPHGGAPDAGLLPPLPDCAPGGGAGCLEYDYQVVAPLGLADEGVPEADLETVLDGLAQGFLDHVERVPTLPTDFFGNLPAPVRVAVIDAMPDGPLLGPGGPVSTSFADGPEQHGYAVGWIVQTLGCESDSWSPSTATAHPCVVDVHFHEGLDRTSDGVVGGDGGRHGTLVGLADQIEQAVATWQADAATGAVAGHGMVINLSLGWHEVFSTLSASDPLLITPARAVHDALRRAVCQGALVLTAAGNAPGGTDPGSGPFYPAVWETEAFPSQTLCQQLGVANAQLDVPADGALLRAVSGLAPDDLALAGTRPDGRPFLAAPARQAVVATSSATHTVPITGTSAAAAVASAAAAVAWAYRPDLDSGGVRWQVLNGGHSLTGSPEAELPIAEFCEGGFEDCCVDENASVCGDPWMRRVSVCGALLAAHEDCQAFCPGCTCPVDCGVGTAPFEDTPVVGLLVEQDCAAPPCTAELVAADTAETVAGCAAPVYRLVDSPTGALENPCVAEQFYDAVMQPRVDPQPDKPPCPHCFAYLDPPGSQVELDLGFDPGVPEILGVTLKVTDPTTGAAVTLDITSAVLDLDLAAGGRYHVTVANLNAGVLGARSRVELSFRFGGPLHDYARTSELGTFLAP